MFYHLRYLASICLKMAMVILLIMQQGETNLLILEYKGLGLITFVLFIWAIVQIALAPGDNPDEDEEDYYTDYDRA